MDAETGLLVEHGTTLIWVQSARFIKDRASTKWRRTATINAIFAMLSAPSLPLQLQETRQRSNNEYT
jgi:hypothetical protein